MEMKDNNVCRRCARDTVHNIWIIIERGKNELGVNLCRSCIEDLKLWLGIKNDPTIPF